MTLEQEAEEYAESINKNLFGMRIYERYRSTKQDFIAGANSKWVKVEKIKAQIDMLKSIGTVHDESCMSERVRDKIKELEQQLKHLEDESF